MANGPQTQLFQTALQLLMQGRQPSPLAPVPTAPITPPGGLLQMPPGPPPEPAPVAPPPALDQSLIEQLTGPRPVAPVAQPESLLQKIALALQGFGAGTQGYGSQFLANLQEQRERRQREFRAATEQYEANRRRAIGIAENKRQGEQADIQRRADIQSDREFQTWVRKTGVQDQMAIDQMRHAFDLEKQREAERIADERQKEQEAKQLKFKTADLASKYRLAGAKEFSNELAERDLGLRDKVSPRADKWLSSHVQLEQARADRTARLAAGGAGGGAINKQTAKLVEEFNQARGNLITAVARGDAQGQKQLRMRLDSLIRRLAGRPGIEAGYGAGNWPYVKVNGVLSTPETGQQQTAQQPTAQAAAPQAQNNDPLGVR